MDIQNPHDKFFRAVISQSEYAGQLISINVPKEISVQLDWKRLRQVPGSFIDEGYKESFTDALFSIPYRGKEEDVLIGVLVEHKSRPDSKVFPQLLRYQSNIYSSMEKMPILLQLFYHGKEKWNLPLSFFESLDLGGCLKRAKILGIPRKSALKMLIHGILGMTPSENTPFWTYFIYAGM